MSISRRHLITVAPASLLAADAVAQTAPDLLSANGLRLSPGVYNIARNTVVRSDVVLDPGARFVVAPGATLTFLGHFGAPIGPVFSGGGRVDLAQGRTREAYPEWWGGLGDSDVDCILAMEACLAAHPIMRLGPHSYLISRTLVVDANGRHITGTGQRSFSPHTGTRIVLTGTGDVMRVGPLRQPASVNNFVDNVMISNLELTRPQPPGGSGHDAQAGLRIRYALYADISRVWSSESVNGFAIGGAVRTFLRDCTAFRSLGGGSRSFRGFSCDGNVEIGLAGGNASIYLVDCTASTGGSPPLDESVGLLLDGAFADTYAANFETSAIAVGMRLSGRASSLSSGKRRTGHADVRIVGPVLDQCTQVGVEITDTSDHTLIDISEPYVASAPGARAAMAFSNVLGQTTVRGGQLIGWTSQSASGILAENSEGLHFSGIKLLQFRKPVRLTSCRDLEVGVAVNQPEGNGDGPAVSLTDCAEAIVTARVKGSPGAFTSGVAVAGARTQEVDVKVAGIRRDTVGGAPRRVTWSGTPNGAVRLS